MANYLVMHGIVSGNFPKGRVVAEEVIAPDPATRSAVIARFVALGSIALVDSTYVPKPPQP